MNQNFVTSKSPIKRQSPDNKLKARLKGKLKGLGAPNEPGQLGSLIVIESKIRMEIRSHANKEV